jgi:hypothetical protein
MTSTRPRARRALAALALLIVGCGGGGGGAQPPTSAIRTVAYVLTECSVDAFGMGSIRQELRIQVGDGPSVAVPGVHASGEGTLFPTACFVLAGDRFGESMQAYLPYKRLGVTPDGSHVVFEVASVLPEHVAILGDADFTIDEGIYVVRSDGTDLQRFGPPSREPPFRLINLNNVTALSIPGFASSPDGRQVVFTDLGPGAGGEDAIQVFSLDLASGARLQLTALPRGPSDPCEVDAMDPIAPCRPGTSGAFFLDNQRVAFFTTANPDGSNPDGEVATYVVHRDGSGLQPGPRPPSLPTGILDPKFAITGPQPSVLVLPLAGEPKGPPSALTLNGFPYQLEAFLLDGDNLLQLTAFGYNDIAGAVLTTDLQRVLFSVSADPPTHGDDGQMATRNPTHNCQIFSIDRNGGDLRQLTNFSETVNATIGCYYTFGRNGCSAGFMDIDPVTGTLIFVSNCDPFKTNPNGSQLFAMRPDGSDLRQITTAAGLTFGADGGERLELVGPHAYSAPVHGTRPR